ncbi:type II toxin-antitoxin system PemI/MazE family antitoxin [Lentilactobacillus kisonensis]|uniref:Toxin-antitoxin system, antitoxin component, AbrB family n=2 Tax=Lentilactobacillus kisonensis TaxID=481722 RepID=H1LI75_9LACO|nr:AbrB family transcriptional regulator [Lentilactobacillus kisonensis]EHO49908.1 toxin-antitoxin system, antitoxin component, AbrB family [Lentilactobacillus kisonensis F0435]KRL22129.1 toxin-antitoxin system, antitoxin component, AbrB family [Lentilactobacillus kisonensis DSM 19906 = JCM 15041]
MIVKTKKYGNSIMIPIPKGFGVSQGAEFIAVQDDDGAISFIPAHHNIFEQNPEYNVRAALQEMAIPDNGNNTGKEDIW